MPSKAGMLAKTVKLATAWREIRNITASTAEGRPATASIPEIVEHSTIRMPTTHEFSRKFAKK